MTRRRAANRYDRLGGVMYGTCVALFTSLVYGTEQA